MLKAVYSLGLIILSGALMLQGADFHRNNFAIGVGAATPVGSSTSYLSTAPLVSLGYGYRFNRFLQADAGLQFAFGAADNQSPVQTNLGVFKGGDREYMVPLGGRFIVPLPFERIEASVGGGGAYLHYSETAPSSAYYQNFCYTCTSRGGWGGYGLANISYFLDQGRNFHIGLTYQFISASTNGEPVGNVPAIKTTDHWTNALLEFGFSF
jgi:hypothetical protein